MLLKKLCLILQPFLPHISEEIWCNLDTEELCINQKWPKVKNTDFKLDIKIAVQINGKIRSVIEIHGEKEKKELIKIAKNNDKIKKYLTGKIILKEIFVPNKIINFVIK